MTAPKPLAVVGDVLLDEDIEGVSTRLAPDAPAPVVDVTGDRRHPGGAGVAAALAARGGRDVILVTALGDDAASEAVRRDLRGRVRLLEIPLNGTLPVKTRVLAGGRPVVRIDRGGGTPGGPEDTMPLDAVRDALAEAHAVLVADYGRGTADALRPHLHYAARHTPLVWDPHPRGDAPVPGARVVTPNAAEARALCPGDGGTSLGAYAERGARLAERWRAAGVAVTLGERGVLLARSGTGTPRLVPAPYQATGDPRGAGNPDLWHTRAPARPADVPGTDAFDLAERVRARGGTVVATGGCFDLVHAGHVGLLESARRIGDCLIVCLNSDASVTRRKGPGRPLNPAADRARVLAALGSVDAVAVFDEDTPEELLTRLRPDVWVKGGDYSVQDLPEAGVLRDWGGQAVVLPYLDGRSTTLLTRRAAKAAAGALRTTGS
ncbi:D-glycero-beta-D-manno-heptose 1-phosphate adenylyltransferase [Streptomyces sp. DH24]|uniref:D-glycero-beta-D-manno-heptose 1-phosphate adenylyltransferase n=1 Tax=Streptomyces sp. DH24 TaxID=3040123 RepID=UPI002441F61E|nr:D-glycero-beta-D-manno-heptose 1-phosphate adenylyltransferase [Streptomyces sp. DH24]MDG9719880.1 D-glycero-beta-D-manno-heptose 1-phosphate adenylyltransferase [Streptomyces sp. DH24]